MRMREWERTKSIKQSVSFST